MVFEQDRVKLSIDELGRIDVLSMCGGSNVIARPVSLFRAVIHCGDNWEAVALGEEQDVTVREADGKAVLTVDKLKTRDGVLDIAVEMTVRMEGDRIWFDSKITNNSEATVDEWIYPCLGSIDTLEGGAPDLLFPRHMGERVRNVCVHLKAQTGRENLYEMSATYPGQLSMQWMLLEDGNTCLYLTGRDDKFHTSAMRAKGSKIGGVTLEMNKMGFVKPGETWTCPSYMAWLYEGTWMEAAREYAEWAATWRNPVTPKEWIRHMNGYFLVINKQQYGDEVWPYETIPKLYDYAQEHGFDALGLFGWYHSGHDNQYPDLEVSPTMGGEELLKEGISKVHEKGGHVTLYYQGHLIDVGTKFYKTLGQKVEGKNRWGTPYYEYYDKFCHSDYLHYLSKKPFSTVCPSCTEWHELMADRADWVHGFGADGILYDQIGGMPPYPCFNEEHNHPENRPSLSHAQGRIKLHKRIRKQVDSYNEFAYMTEHITDVHSQFIDCLHGIGSFPGAKGTGVYVSNLSGHKINNDSAGNEMMPELFRYVFPETMITVRNPKPYVDRRFANYAFLYGYKLEMELRYITDRWFIEADEDPEAREYANKLAKLRHEFEDYLLLGRYGATEGLTGLTPGVKAAVFTTQDGRKAIALWNDTDDTLPVHVHMDGFTPNAWASPEGCGEGAVTEIGPEEIRLVYCK